MQTKGPHAFLLVFIRQRFHFALRDYKEKSDFLWKNQVHLNAHSSCWIRLFEQNVVVHLHKINEKQIDPCQGKRNLMESFAYEVCFVVM